jgi:nitroreductase
MEFDDVVRKRRMVRNFQDLEVDTESVDRILDLARRGPSAGFTQGQEFLVITDQNTKRAIAELCDESYYVKSGFDPFISRAPVIIVPCTSEAAYVRRYQEPDKAADNDDEPEWPVPFWFMDGGAAVMIILHSAVNEGLAAAFAGIRDLARMRQLLGIPDEVTPLCVISIGHPAPDKRSPSLKRGRRPFDEMVHRERW